MTSAVSFNEPKEDTILRGLLSFGKKEQTKEHGNQSEKIPKTVKNEPKQEEIIYIEPMDIDRASNVKDDPEAYMVEKCEASIKNPQFESHLEKNYSSTSESSHIEDIKILFKESSLDFEKQKFYQNIFNNILEKTSGNKLELLQKQYLEHLHQISDVQTFICSVCDYETINKSNLKSHLLLLHKSELEFKIFQCLNCKYKTKNLTYLKKHLKTHEEDTFSDIDYSEFDAPSSPEVSKKKKVKRKKITQRQCDLCDFQADGTGLQEHKKTHFHVTEKGKKYKCYKCEFDIWNKPGFKKHLLKEHNIKTLGVEKVKVLKCEHCEYTTDAKESFRVHSLSHKDPNDIQWFTCPHCDFKTKFKRNLTNHILLHNPDQIEKKYLCEVCSRSFRTRSKLKLHSLTHKTIEEVSEVFQCEECTYKTKNKYHLKQHMEVHKSTSEMKTFVCDTCGFQSKRKWNYEAHVLTHKDETEVELHRCDVCGYTTKFKDRLTRHLKKGTHLSGKNGLKPTNYSCSVCNFESINRKSYYDHIQNHDNPEEIAKGRFACEICGFRTKNKGGLVQHSLSHKRTEEVRTFKCPQPGCDFQTKFRGSLAGHVDRHKDITQVTIYKCDICGLQSRSKWNHNIHLITHKSSNEVEVFNCTLCSYQTKFKAYLKAHLKKRHNIVTTRVRVKDVSSNQLAVA